MNKQNIINNHKLVQEVLRNNPKLAAKLQKSIEVHYESMLDNLQNICEQRYLYDSEYNEEAAHLLQDFICNTMEDSMNWPEPASCSAHPKTTAAEDIFNWVANPDYINEL